MKLSFFKRLAQWLENQTSPDPRIENLYETEFCSGIGARLTLSNHHPRFKYEFSEPLPQWLRADFIEWRAECLADFKKRTGMKIGEPELFNEFARPIPYFHQPQQSAQTR